MNDLGLHVDTTTQPNQRHWAFIQLPLVRCKLSDLGLSSDIQFSGFTHTRQPLIRLLCQIDYQLQEIIIIQHSVSSFNPARLCKLCYAALLPRRGPHIASHSVRLSVCPSVCPSVPCLFTLEPSYERTSKIEKLQFSLMGQRHVCTFRHAQRAAYRTAISSAQILVFFPAAPCAC